MFSQTVEYALRAAVAMAQSPGRPLTTAQIAEKTCLPLGYLSKVLQMLVRAKLIKAIRGPHGGYQLNSALGRLSVLDVVTAVDPLERITTCPLGLSGHGTNLCPLHRKLDQAIAVVERAFADTALADLVQEAGGSVPLCPAAASLDPDAAADS